MFYYTRYWKGLAQICTENVNWETDHRVRDLDFKSISNVDGDYQLVASHLNDGTREKIVNQEYVDFAKLLRRDRLGGEDEHQKMVMVNKGWL